jgi:DNA-binding sugar fermentation-stimulating protein
MIFATPVLEGVLLQRYKRFLADVVVSEAALDRAAHAAGFSAERLSEIKKHRSEFGVAAAGEVVKREKEQKKRS